MKMKIGIITFHASHNYGSMLQAYALQTFLEKLGHSVEIINYRSIAQKRVYPKPLSIFFLSHPRALVSILLRPLRTCAMLKKWNLFEEFLEKYLHITKEYNSIRELESESWNYDVVIAGSDQIWNTNPHDFSSAYFLPFIKNAKKIAYAPSLGPTPLKSDLKPYTNLLNKFDSISVREPEAIDVVQQLVGDKRVVDCLDPTLLLTMEDYMKLVDTKPLIQGKYIFYYAPAHTHSQSFDYLSLANEIGRKNNCQVIVTQDSKALDEFPYIKTYFSVGPKEFLNLIKNAEFVCGRSFHMVVFSILLQKEFYTINAADDARCNNLLNKVHLMERNISNTNINVFEKKEIDYTKVMDLLNNVCSDSKKYLLDSMY